jgi:hypothetical protein
LQTNFPIFVTNGCAFQRLTALSKVNGIAKIVAIIVPKKAMPIVNSSKLTKVVALLVIWSAFSLDYSGLSTFSLSMGMDVFKGLAIITVTSSHVHLVYLPRPP